MKIPTNQWDLYIGDLVAHRIKAELGYGIIIKDISIFQVLWSDGQIRRHKPRNLNFINRIHEN